MAENIEAILQNATENGIIDEKYQAFVDKYKPKLTQDDCYTPPVIYEAVRDWALDEYGWRGREVVRPFYPGGDYEAYDYPENCVVIDNPPWSCLAKIVEFYADNNIDYFLFCQAVTCFNYKKARSHVAAYCKITYQNGACINTSFLSSQGPAIRTAPTLTRAIKEANKKTERALAIKKLPKYAYPDGVVSSSILGLWSNRGVEYQEDNVQHLRTLDDQRPKKKAIYGAGYLVPRDKARAARIEAENVTVAIASEPPDITWELSEREIKIIEQLENGRGDC